MPAAAASAGAAPSPPTTYTARINRVVDYIDAHLAEPLDLNRLAQVAHFSPWHFHRLFHALTGETLADRVRRRRLESAALRLLIRPPPKALSVALDVGFASPEVFARNFKAHFGVTPSAWQHGAHRHWTDERRAQMRAIHAAAREHGLPLDDAPIAPTPVVTLKTLPMRRLAYLRYVGPYGVNVIQQTWQRLIDWHERHGLPHEGYFGIGHDSPEIAAPETCRYDACVVVGDAFRPLGEIGVQQFEGGLHACAAFDGTPDRIHAAWTFMYRDWLPSSGCQPAHGPSFESYGREIDWDRATGRFTCELCVPVRPL